MGSKTFIRENYQNEIISRLCQQQKQGLFTDVDIVVNIKTKLKNIFVDNYTFMY